ncbi:CidA/LrgA family protein [Exiguobacterium antarcticum]|uniref:CidA/LrgA family protein n=1 Tax=Exiguobacterium antarcticum TaxID=132920 RepID=A0ABT6R1F7_9BACL|nr:CidA/LrgA family protein [Exiguobacterium antarcticum]MDI3234772.1 CidA/LrgA family protein [Exiguobacterium antarcticum]
MRSKLLLSVTILLQIVLISCFAMIGNVVSTGLQLPLPGNIIGLILLYLALKSRLLKVSYVEQGGRLLLLVMPLFFVPALSGIMDYTVFMRQSGLQVLVILIISSLLTLTGSAFLVDRLARRKEEVDIHE